MDPHGSHASQIGDDNGNDTNTVAVNGIPVADATPVPNVSTMTETPVVPVRLIADHDDEEEKQEEKDEEQQQKQQKQQQKGLRRSTATARAEQDERLAATAAATAAKHGLGRKPPPTTNNTTGAAANTNTDVENAATAPAFAANRNDVTAPNSPAGIWTPSMIHYKTEAVDDSQESLLAATTGTAPAEPPSPSPPVTVPTPPPTSTRVRDTTTNLDASSDNGTIEPASAPPSTNNKQKKENDDQDDIACRFEITRRQICILGVAGLLIAAVAITFFVTRATAPETGTGTGSDTSANSNSSTNSDNFQQVPLDSGNGELNSPTNNENSPSPTNLVDMLDATDLLSMTPTTVPSNGPSIKPLATTTPTNLRIPSAFPSMAPTGRPSNSPSGNPTIFPTGPPTTASTRNPSSIPTTNPTEIPTSLPTQMPTINPTTKEPTQPPTAAPTTKQPTPNPTTSLPTTMQPTTRQPTLRPQVVVARREARVNYAFLNDPSVTTFEEITPEEKANTEQIIVDFLNEQYSTLFPSYINNSSSSTQDPSPPLGFQQRSDLGGYFWYQDMISEYNVAGPGEVPTNENVTFFLVNESSPLQAQVGILFSRVIPSAPAFRNLRTLLVTTNPLPAPQLTTTTTTPATVELFGVSYDVATTTRIARHAGLTETIPSEIGLLTSLTRVDLSSYLLPVHSITGNIPSEIGLLTALRYLNLDYNDITGIIPSEIGLLTAMSTMSFWNNQLTGEIPSEIGSLAMLTYLALHTNDQLSGSVPISLCSNPNLQSILVDCPAVTCTCNECECM